MALTFQMGNSAYLYLSFSFLQARALLLNRVGRARGRRLARYLLARAAPELKSGVHTARRCSSVHSTFHHTDSLCG
eukprot:350665-Chlamydomonas_euryale.AAC.3